jgi:Na+/proline symporter
VTLAAVKIANVMLGWERWQTVLVCAAICIVFSTLSGLWGVLATDIIQFAIAMVGVFAAAYYAVRQPEVGGLDGLVTRIDPATLSLLPDFGDTELLVTLLVIPLAVQWWSVWYPGSEPGGGSYIAQRMLAARDERHSMGATLWFTIAHYALRPWPWIIVALASLLVFPTLGDIKSALPGIDDQLLGNDIAYPAMLTLLPHGLLGLLIASLLAAYVSTMSTHLNWGASYLVHDFYRRFIRPQAAERHYVRVSRLATAGLMLTAAASVYLLSTAGEAFQLLLSIGAGTGLLYLLRWFWWRINAWSEIAAMASSFFVAVGLMAVRKLGVEIPAHLALTGNVAFTTVVWGTVTFLTRPADRETLIRFCRLIRPAGPGWRDIRTSAGVKGSPDSLPQAFLGWSLGCLLVYAALFGTGSFIYGRALQGAVCALIAAVSAAGLWLLLHSMWSSTEKDERT